MNINIRVLADRLIFVDPLISSNSQNDRINVNKLQLEACDKSDYKHSHNRLVIEAD